MSVRQVSPRRGGRGAVQRAKDYASTTEDYTDIYSDYNQRVPLSPAQRWPLGCQNKDLQRMGPAHVFSLSLTGTAVQPPLQLQACQVCGCAVGSARWHPRRERLYFCIFQVKRMARQMIGIEDCSTWGADGSSSKTSFIGTSRPRRMRGPARQLEINYQEQENLT